MVIFHMYTLLHCASCNAIWCKKCLNKLPWKIWHDILHEYFLHMWFALGVTNSKPNEYEH
jgi:hypothetical protein